MRDLPSLFELPRGFRPPDPDTDEFPFRLTAESMGWEELEGERNDKEWVKENAGGSEEQKETIPRFDRRAAWDMTKKYLLDTVRGAGKVDI